MSTIFSIKSPNRPLEALQQILMQNLPDRRAMTRIHSAKTSQLSAMLLPCCVQRGGYRPWCCQAGRNVFASKRPQSLTPPSFPLCGLAVVHIIRCKSRVWQTLHQHASQPSPKRVFLDHQYGRFWPTPRLAIQHVQPTVLDSREQALVYYVAIAVPPPYNLMVKTKPTNSMHP